MLSRYNKQTHPLAAGGESGVAGKQQGLVISGISHLRGTTLVEIPT